MADMKKSILFIPLMILLITANHSNGSDTLYYRFSNYVVKDASPNDTLIFDIEIRSSTSGTYLSGFQHDIYFNTSVFGINALPVAVMPLELFTAAFIVPSGPMNPTTNSFRYANFPFPPYNPAALALVPATWAKLVRYKMLIINNTENLGLQFNVAAMTGNQKYVQTVTILANSYSPIVASNDLLNFPSTPTSFDLLISELGDPSDSDADFIELYNAGASPVDFSLHEWYLTVFNGITYQDIPLSGTLGAGECHVVGGSAFGSAYPGKGADQTAGLVEQNGTVSWYLTLLSPYSTGILADQYNGGSVPFTGKHAVRKYSITQPGSSFNTVEWTVTPANNMIMTPGSHRATIDWDGSTDIEWADTSNWTPSYVPDAGHNAQVPVSVVPPPTISSGTGANVHDVTNGLPEAK